MNQVLRAAKEYVHRQLVQWNGETIADIQRTNTDIHNMTQDEFWQCAEYALEDYTLYHEDHQKWRNSNFYDPEINEDWLMKYGTTRALANVQSAFVTTRLHFRWPSTQRTQLSDSNVIRHSDLTAEQRVQGLSTTRDLAAIQRDAGCPCVSWSERPLNTQGTGYRDDNLREWDVMLRNRARRNQTVGPEGSTEESGGLHMRTWSPRQQGKKSRDLVTPAPF